MINCNLTSGSSRHESPSPSYEGSDTIHYHVTSATRRLVGSCFSGFVGVPHPFVYLL